MAVLSGLKPEKVFEYFEKLCSVPHGSGNTKITGDSMIGEYFRVFISYAVITVALVMYEAKKRKSQSMLGQMLAQAQLEEEGKTE